MSLAASLGNDFARGGDLFPLREFLLQARGEGHWAHGQRLHAIGLEDGPHFGLRGNFTQLAVEPVDQARRGARRREHRQVVLENPGKIFTSGGTSGNDGWGSREVTASSRTLLDLTKGDSVL